MRSMKTDVTIIGGGIAGISAAAFLSERMEVALVEAEGALGYHATGRSAAMYTECYGNETIRRLAIASRSFLFDRDQPLGAERGVLFLAPTGEAKTVDARFDTFSPLVPSVQRLNPSEVADLCEAIPADRTAGAVLEPTAMEVDVHGVESTFRAMARAHDAQLLLDHRATAIDPVHSGWVVRAGDLEIESRYVVNAAGAWGDEVASLAGVAPLGLSPLKRSAFLFNPGVPTAEWPLVVDIEERWYMKPEGPNLLGSAASELPSAPVDARADELDIALGIERINEATTLGVRSISTSWAGLRTFSPDRAPAVGFDDRAENFFWLVGQGGFGIKTSPTLGRLTSSLLFADPSVSPLGDVGINADDLSPRRFRR